MEISSPERLWGEEQDFKETMIYEKMMVKWLEQQPLTRSGLFKLNTSSHKYKW